MRDPEIPRDLKQRYSEGRLIPFIGAGASMAVTWKDGGVYKRGRSWTELVSTAAKLIGFDDPSLLRVRGNDLQILEYFSDKKNEEFAELRSWFEREMHPDDEALAKSRIHAALANLTRCELIYTTNYDDFIERALTIHGRRTVSVSIEAHIADNFVQQSASPDLPNITEVVKFHGDLKNPSRMVLSESDYQSRMSFAEVEDQRLKSDLLGRALLFIGYSFSDMNVSYLFRLVNETFGRKLPSTASGTRAYIAIADPSDFEYTLFRRRNIDVIPIDSMDRANGIAAILDGLGS